MNRRFGRVRNERGAVLVYVGLAMTAMIALTAVGIDVSQMAFTAAEVQNAADIAATAGAKAALGSTSPLSDAQAAASTVLGSNHVIGQVATVAVPPANIEVGNWVAPTFTAGGNPVDAVRATGVMTVNNLLAGVFGSSTTEVTKIAIATFGALGEGQPSLPLVIGDCHFPDPDCHSDDCLPSLTQVPNTTNNTGWTGFFGGTGANQIRDFFPTQCVKNGGGTPAPEVSVDDSLNLNNGQEQPLLDAVKCMFDLGITQFVVPVVSCDGNFNQSSAVVGFATIVVDAVVTTGHPKGIDLHAIFNANAPGPSGGENFGTGFVQLVG